MGNYEDRIAFYMLAKGGEMKEHILQEIQAEIQKSANGLVVNTEKIRVATKLYDEVMDIDLKEALNSYVSKQEQIKKESITLVDLLIEELPKYYFGRPSDRRDAQRREDGKLRYKTKGSSISINITQQTLR